MTKLPKLVILSKRPMKKTCKKKTQYGHSKVKPLSKVEQRCLGQEPIEAIKNVVKRHDEWQRKALASDARPL